jgi:nucleoside-diphosphate-sugar epimerase
VPRLLIAGCGYVGAALADLFHDAGWEVEGWTRSAQSAASLAGKEYKVSTVDITDGEQVAGSTGKFDAVVHCASTHGGDAGLYRRVYFEGARQLLEHFAPPAFLFTSSTSVYAQDNGEWVTEESVAEPAHENGKILRQAETLVQARGGVVARLAGVYGPGRAALLKRLMKGEARIDSENDRFINQVHRDDAAAALFLLLNGQGKRGEIFNVVDSEPVRQSECYRWLAQRLNRPLPATGPALSPRKRGRSHKRVSNTKLRALGWTPRYPSFVAGMEKSVLPSLAQEPL